MRYHAHMKFRVLSGAFAGEVGILAATDFEHDTTDLLMPAGPILTFLNREIELTDHDRL